ncbi:MAG: winged helix-turn-helix transcriptional regulator [Candidatus Micrarchaeia archaeon]
MQKSQAKLDALSRRILFELDGDARAPLARMARKLKISPQRLAYRIRALEKAGIIKGYTALIDYKSAGYTFYTAYYALKNISPRVLAKFARFLLAEPKVCILLACEGRWDVMVGVLARDPLEFYNILLAVRNRFGGYILERTILTHIGARHCRRKYLVGKEFSEEEFVHITGGKLSRVHLVRGDEELLRALSDNARAGVLELATRLGESPHTVRSRLRRLMRERIILRTGFLPDHARYGYAYKRVLLSLYHTTAERFELLKNFLVQHPNVKRTTSTFGRYDLVVDGEFESEQDFRAFITELRTKFGGMISSYDTLNVLKIYRFRFFPCA